VLRDAGIEAVGGEGVRALHETKVTLLDDEMQVAALAADRAVALLDADARRGEDFEAYGAAVAAAGVGDL
jgi:tetraacyldisaccharide-1-P 4'-kinase